MYIKSVQILFGLSLFLFLHLSTFGEKKELTPEQLKVMERFHDKRLKQMYAMRPLKQDKMIIAFDNSPLPVSNNKEVIEKAIVFASNKSYLNHSTIETDIFLLPNYRYSNFEIEWNSVSNKNKTLKVIDASNVIAIREGFIKNRIVTEDKEDIPDTYTMVHGKMKINIPYQFEKITFSPQEAGIEKSVNGIVVKLIKCIQDLAIIETNSMNKSKEIIFFYDKDGKHIKGYGSRRLYDRKRHRTTIPKRANGIIAKIEIYFPVKTIQRTIDVTGSCSNKDFLIKSKIINPRFSLIRKKLKFIELSEQEVREKIRIVPDRGQGVFFNALVVKVALPQYDNTHYSIIQFSKPIVKNRHGRRLHIETFWRHFYNATEYYQPMIINSTKEGEIIEFAEITGTVKIKYPLKVVTENYSIKDNLPENMQFISTNILKYKPTVLNIVNKKNYQLPDSVRAFDENNRMLKSFYVEPTSRRKIDPKTGEWVDLDFCVTNYFQGIIARLEIDRVKKWVEIKIPYKLKSIPMLSEDMELLFP